jgi:hypothetical protein
MPSVVKKLLVLAVASAVAIAVLEIGAAHLYQRVRHRPFAREELTARLLNAAPSEPESVPAAPSGNDPRVADQPVILHPYFGYVANPTKARVNAYGFFGPEPLATRGSDVVLVGVLGGSVADLLVKNGGEALADALQEVPQYRGRRIELINLALGGYKQPQQVLVIATLLAIGAQFDIVINVDGFNEIDGAKDNQQDGVNPYFPYTWNLHARQGFDRDAVVHIARADQIRSRRETLRTWFQQEPAPHSAFLLTLWDFLDAREDAALRAETVALRDTLARASMTAQQKGPPAPLPDGDDEALYRDYAEVWARASLETALLCAGFGIRYFHFLQPNQYLPGAKQLTDEERAIAFDPDVADTQRVAIAYPILRERGRELIKQGVAFTDLAMLFRDEPRTVYGDSCCHYNALGNELMAQAIGRAIDEASRGDEGEATEPGTQPDEPGAATDNGREAADPSNEMP